ncbi:MAG: AlpA family transcriptional regulator [Gammaproteobacteria bacterium]|nr:AlpA family transcriptional regulator [Gammaproteobacteria bacterium]
MSDCAAVLSMSPRRPTPRSIAVPADARQLSLGLPIETATGRRVPTAPRALGSPRELDLDPVLAMRDVVRVTGKHRATIHRWMNLGLFPKKSVPRARPVGWLRSEVARWLSGEKAIDPPPQTLPRGLPSRAPPHARRSRPEG